MINLNNLKHFLLIILLLTTSIFGKKKIPEEYQNRDYFGKSDTLWSYLTAFERHVLHSLEKAKNGDPDALLAYGIFASGDIRTMSEYKSIEKKVHKFVSKTKPMIKKASTKREKHQVVYKELCEYFYKEKWYAYDLKGYDFDESALSVIFTKRKYNCVSSAILYIILARYFDLDAYGAIIPSHVFIECPIDSNKTISIETTTKNGFDAKQTKETYSSRRSGWFRRRGLTAATYDDYLNRQKATPFELISYNTNNQHTGLDRMALHDKIRLSEIAYSNNKENPDILNVLLSFFSSEYYHLVEKKDSLNIKRFTPYVKRLLSQIPSTIQQDTSVIKYGDALRNAFYGIGTEDHPRVYIDSILEIYNRYKNDTSFVAKAIRNNSQISINSLLSRFIEKDSLEAVHVVLDRIKTQPQWKDIYESNYYNCTSQQFSEAVDQQQWDKALHYITILKEYSRNRKNKKALETNYQSVQTNRFNQRINNAMKNKQWTQALIFVDSLNQYYKDKKDVKNQKNYINYRLHYEKFHTSFSEKKWDEALSSLVKSYEFMTKEEDAEQSFFKNVSACVHNKVYALLRENKEQEACTYILKSIKQYPKATDLERLQKEYCK